MMSDHELKSLRHTRILEFHKFYSEYHLWLQSSTDRFRIRIRIYETNDGRFFFVQSHYVHTPLYDGDASSTQLSHDTSHLALSHAINSITTSTRAASAPAMSPATSGSSRTHISEGRTAEAWAGPHSRAMGEWATPACSRHAATRRTRSSRQGGPITWTPIGRAAPSLHTGTAATGSPMNESG